jgi:hypothetical protein
VNEELLHELLLERFGPPPLHEAPQRPGGQTTRGDPGPSEIELARQRRRRRQLGEALDDTAPDYRRGRRPA